MQKGKTMFPSHRQFFLSFLLTLGLLSAALLVPARSARAQSGGTPTTVTVTSSSSAPSFSGGFILTAAVSPSSGTTIPTGALTLALSTSGSSNPFYSSTGALLSNGTVTLTYTPSLLGGVLPPGNYTLTASYAPFANSSFQASTGALNFTLYYPIAVVAGYAPSPPLNTQPITLNTSVYEPLGVSSANAPTPTGSLAFTVTPSGGGSAVFTQTATLGSNGGASVTIPAGMLAVGTYTLTEAYTPDANSFDLLPATTSVNMTVIAQAGTQGTVYDRGDFTSVLTNDGTEATPGGNGAEPAYLVYDSANGLFYGSASLGGANGVGDVFTFNPTNGAIADVGDFTSSNYVLVGSARNNPGGNGANPGMLVYDSANSLFYGVAGSGGVTGDGDIFSFDPSDADSSTSIADVGDFNTPIDSGGLYTAGGNGADPSALVYDSIHGLFYGTAEFGGANGQGDVFTFMPSNTNPSASITDVADFIGTYNSADQLNLQDNGESPTSLIYDSANGLFYGTAELGGANDVGDVFSFNAATNALTDEGDFTSNLYNLDYSFDGGNGSLPNSLVYDSVNGLFYGTALLGGANGYSGGGIGDGNIFSFNPASPAASSITDVADFNNANGIEPRAPLVYSPANGRFYGTASSGATASSDGDVYTFDPTTNILTDAANLGVANASGSGDNGDNPGALALDGSGNLYGVALHGGAIGSGDIFSFVPTPPVTTGGGSGGSGTTTPTPLNTFGAGLQMVCLDEVYANLAAAFDATPPAYDTYNGSNYVLANSATEAAPAPGTAFWVDFSSPTSIYDAGSAVTTATVPLHQGWNMIGDPFGPPQISASQGYLLANIVVTGSGGQTATGLTNANAAGLLYGTLYSYPAGASSYTSLDGTVSGASLSPFTGYWLYAFHSGETLTMTPGPSEILQPTPLLP